MVLCMFQLLLHLARGIFEEQTNLEKLVQKIMLDAQDLLKCEKCCVYLLEDTCERVSVHAPSALWSILRHALFMSCYIMLRFILQLWCRGNQVTELFSPRHSSAGLNSVFVLFFLPRSAGNFYWMCSSIYLLWTPFLLSFFSLDRLGILTECVVPWMRTKSMSDPCFI